MVAYSGYFVELDLYSMCSFVTSFLFSLSVFKVHPFLGGLTFVLSLLGNRLWFHSNLFALPSHIFVAVDV